MRNLKKYLHYLVAILIVASFGYMCSRILFRKRGLKTKEGTYVYHRLNGNKLLKDFIDGKRAEYLPKTTTVSLGPQVYHRNLPRANLYVSDATTTAETEEIMFRYIEEIEMFCKDDRRMGSQHDGGWNVCNSPPFTMRNPCLVYSFGIGNDWVFDDAMISFFNCTVKAYDPSMSVDSHVRSKKIYFENTGIAGVNSVNEKGWQFKTFKQYLEDSGQTEEDPTIPSCIGSGGLLIRSICENNVNSHFCVSEFKRKLQVMDADH